MLKKAIFLFEACLFTFFVTITGHAIVQFEVVLEPDPAHSWENQSVGTPFVVYDQDEGLYKMWYSGNPWTDPEYSDDGIGYATSIDGVNWQNRQLVDGIGSGYSEISHPWVIRSGSTYGFWRRHYYDECAGQWSSYITYCESPDGINCGPETYNFGCPGKTWELYEFYLGSLLQKGDTTFLYYNAVQPSWYQAIGRATSTDGGMNWFDRILVLPPESVVYHDSVALHVMMPNVTLKGDGSYVMFFAFNFWPFVGVVPTFLAKATSQDGVNWTNIKAFLTPEMLGANVTGVYTPFYFKDIDGKEYLYFAFTENTKSSAVTRIARILLCGDGMAINFPDTHWVFEAHAISPVIDSVYFGNLGSCSVEDIDPSSIRINDSIPITSSAVLNEGEYPDTLGLTGKVMLITFDARGLIANYGWVFDTAAYQLTVSGGLNNGSCFAAYGDVVIIGHRSGDLNGDGNVNVADVTYLVSYLFQGGSPPPVLEAADVNADNRVNIADITYLVNYLFRGGPGPLHG
jgi:hypothetical protein